MFLRNFVQKYYGHTFSLEAVEVHPVKTNISMEEPTSRSIESHTSSPFWLVYALTIIRSNIYKQTNLKTTGEF